MAVISRKKRVVVVTTSGEILRVPADEAWLYRNPKALRSVRNGIRQAKQHKFVKAPEIK